MSSLNDKLQNLKTILSRCKSITVALSGGVDSAFLLAFAVKTLGADRVYALTACGSHIALDETEYAARLCKSLGVEYRTTEIKHVLSIIKDNPPDRCYLCKREIFSAFSEIAAARGSTLVDGTNLDDTNDYRPGHRALKELGVLSPLKEAGMTKADIRSALKELAGSDENTASALTLDDGTPMWKKPAFACLASRIPYGEQISEEKLSAVYESELFLKKLGFTQIRVRHHGDIARIETLTEEREIFFDKQLMAAVNDKLKSLGFKYVTLDLGGYKMGGGYNDEKPNNRQQR